MVLPALTVLNPRYAVRRSLGAPGPFSITYLGWDIETEEQVVIQEYLPASLAQRGEDDTAVVVRDDDKHAALFQAGLKYFLKEAMVLSEVEHPHVIPQRAPFEALGTAYRVREHRPGMSLAAGIEKKGALSERAAVTIVDAILDALDTTHGRGLLHGGVAPEAIHVMKDGRALLHDFRSAFIQLARRSDHLADAVRPGTSAPEQYAAKGKQGPWTDVYACAATVCQVVTGEPVPAAPERLDDDPLAARLQADDRFTPAVREVLLQALALNPKTRIRTAQAFRQQLQDALSASQQRPQLTKVDTASPEDVAPADDHETASVEETEPDSSPVSADQEELEPQEAADAAGALPPADDPSAEEEHRASAESTEAEAGPEAPEAGEELSAAGETHNRSNDGDEAPPADASPSTDPVDAMEAVPPDEAEDPENAESEIDDVHEDGAEDDDAQEDIVSAADPVREDEDAEIAPQAPESVPGSEAAADAASSEDSEEEAAEAAAEEDVTLDEEDAAATQDGASDPAATNENEPSETEAAPVSDDGAEPSEERVDRPAAPPASTDAGDAKQRAAQVRRSRLLTRIGIPLLLLVVTGAVLMAWTGAPWNRSQAASPYTALRAYGDSLFARADYAGAKSFYIQALEVRPEDEYVAGRLQDVEQIRGEELEAQYARQLQQGDAMAVKADSLLSEEDLEGAIAAFEAARAAYRGAYEYRPNDAVIADRIQEVDSLIVSVREVNDQQETSERMYTLFRQQGDEQFTVRNYRVAARKYREALDYRPGDEYLQEQLEAANRLLAEQQAERQYAAHIAQGDSLVQAERYAAARVQYNRALEVRPQDSLASAQLAKIEEVLAEENQRERQFQYHRGRGDVYYDESAYEAAIASYRKALEYRANDPYVISRIRASEEAIAAQQRDEERQRQAIQERAEALRQQRVQDDGVYTAVDTEPVLIGGLAGLHREVRYPSEAVNAGIEGRVYLEVVVDEDGSVREASVTKGIGGGCDQEALRVVRQAEFQPARLDGEAVPYRHALWIQFKLEEQQRQEDAER